MTAAIDEFLHISTLKLESAVKAYLAAFPPLPNDKPIENPDDSERTFVNLRNHLVGRLWDRNNEIEGRLKKAGADAGKAAGEIAYWKLRAEKAESGQVPATQQFTVDDLKHLADGISAQWSKPPPDRAVMNNDEARRYIGKKSHSAFNRWCAQFHVYPATKGRYAKHRLDLGLERESRTIAPDSRGKRAGIVRVLTKRPRPEAS